LSRALFFLGAALVLLALLPGFSYLVLYAVFPLICALLRCLSKNWDKRQLELDAYRDVTEGIRERAARQRCRWKDRENRYFRCRACGTTFRVPRGQGKVRITCPGCQEQMVKKT